MIEWTPAQFMDLSEYLEKRNPGHFFLPSYMYRRNYEPDKCKYDLHTSGLSFNYAFYHVLYDSSYEDLPLAMGESLERNLIIEWRLKKGK